MCKSRFEGCSGFEDIVMLSYIVASSESRTISQGEAVSAAGASAPVLGAGGPSTIPLGVEVLRFDFKVQGVFWVHYHNVHRNPILVVKVPYLGSFWVASKVHKVLKR